jgi:DNA-binding protein H-NS
LKNIDDDVFPICYFVVYSNFIWIEKPNMAQTYKELLQQREALEQAIAQARQNEISSAVAKIRELVAEYGLTAQDVFPGRGAKSPAAKSASKVAAKYRDPATGQTWTGRGKAPKWIEGKDRTPFVIA